MYRTLMPSVSIVATTFVAIYAGSAVADSPNLKGSYGFTGTAACLVAPGHDPNNTTNLTPGVALPNSGFQPNLRPKDAVAGGSQNSFTRSFSVEGIRTFNGDGTGTVKGTAVGIDGRPTPGPGGFPSFPPSAGSGDFQFSFTYTVDGNGGWTATMVPGSYTETFTSGPRATPTQQTATVDAIPPITGMISQDGKTLIAAHDTPVVETVSYSNGDVWPEICHRSRVFIKLPGGDDDDGHGNDHH
jgi:hypothetical protein